jgi:hypothetical protein
MKRLASLARDAAGCIGGILFFHGVDMIYRPAAFIVGGLLLAGGSFALSAGRKRG